MNSVALWQQRRLEHHKQLLVYLRYVLNDHFLLIVFFMLGALLMQYSKYLEQTVTLPFVVWGVVVAGVAISIFFGNIATLLKPADALFLSVQEQSWQPYFLKAVKYSTLLPSVVLLFITGFIAPVCFKFLGAQVLDVCLLFGVLFCLKQLDLTRRIFRWYRVVNRPIVLCILLYSFYVVILSSFLFVMGQPVYESMIFASVSVLSWILRRWVGRVKQYRWNEMIELEMDRKRRIQQLFSLFVDIPERQKHAAHRRKYVDFVVHWLSAGRFKSADRYLMARAFVRSNAYISTIFPVVCISVIVTSTVSHIWLATVLQMGCFFIIGFQLLALYYHYQNHAMMQVIPIFSGQKVQDIQAILQKVLGGLWLLWGVLSFILLPFSPTLLASRVAVLLFIEVFIYVYSPLRLRKK